MRSDLAYQVLLQPMMRIFPYDAEPKSHVPVRPLETRIYFDPECGVLAAVASRIADNQLGS
jgi:hypothetical protein